MKKIISIASLGMLLITGQAVPAFAASSLVPTATASTAAPAGFKTTDQTPTSIGLSWTAVAGAPQYRVMFSKKPDMSNAGFARSLGSNTSIDIRDLSAGTIYYFKVRVINTDGTSVSPYSNAITTATKAQPAALPAMANPLKISTFNVRCANCTGTEPEYLSWDKRRDTVVAQIKSKMPDVVGLQEASQGWLKDSAGNQINLSQFEDLKQRLNAAGAPYELTNSNRNNCVKSTTPSNCVYADQGASQDSKIIYNKNTVSLISQGSVQLPANDPTANGRYVSWAILQQTSTNKKFFVTDTHLQPGDGTANYDARKAQAQKIVEVIQAKNTEKLPTFIVGDMNSSKWTDPENSPYNIFTKAGYIDPTGGTAKSSIASGYATAEKFINAKYGSFNGFNRQLKAPVDASPRYLGSHIDYIFTSKMRVGVWEQVLNVDANGLLQGVVPSDHNMIMATVELPSTSAPATSAPVSTLSAIASKALALNGALGRATSAEVSGLRNGGAFQMYDRGAIIWSPASGAHVSNGAIRGLWAETGFENGGLGYPTTDEIYGLRNGGVYQNYQGGSILWSPATGAHFSIGSIRAKWAETGYENGGLGYPTSNEVYGLRDGGVYQMFEHGAILWSPATGAHVSMGGIRSMWATTGFENGRLGYPTSDEYLTGNGNVAQNYQGGVIHWGLMEITFLK